MKSRQSKRKSIKNIKNKKDKPPDVYFEGPTETLEHQIRLLEKCSLHFLTKCFVAKIAISLQNKKNILQKKVNGFNFSKRKNEITKKINVESKSLKYFLNIEKRDFIEQMILEKNHLSMGSN